MAFALVVQAKGSGNDAYSTNAVDTTGANLLILTFADVFADESPPTITDTYSNTWLEGRDQSPFGQASRIFYAENPTVGAGHTVTITGTDQFGSAQLSAFSGAATSGVLDQTNENLSFGSATVQPGTVTPTEDNELIIAHFTFDVGSGGMPTANSGFVSPLYGDVGSGGVYLGSGVTYLIQTTAGAVNPTFTRVSGTSNNYATIATFKAGAAPPPAAPAAPLPSSPPGRRSPMGRAQAWQGVSASEIIPPVAHELTATGTGVTSGSLAVSLAGVGVWEDITPAGVNLDPDDPSPGSNFGFQTIAIASDGTLYVTLDHSGLYRSLDFGDTWTHRSTDGDLESGTPWTLQVDPFDDDVLWSNAGFGNGGPLKSTDGGQTWTLMSVGSPTQNNDVYCIAMDPDLDGHMLVSWHSLWVGSVPSGISESFDWGATWTNHNPPGGSSWGTGHAVFFLSDSDTWLVATQDDGVWRTANGGTSWTQVHTTDLTHGATDCLTKVGSSLFIALKDVVAESTDDGVTWTDISTGITGTDDLSNIATDGINLYTAPSFPIAGSHSAANGPWWVRSISGGSWTQLTDSPNPTHLGVSNGPRQSVSAGPYIFTVNYLAGIWRFNNGVAPLTLAATGNSQSSGGSLAMQVVHSVTATGTGTSTGSLAVVRNTPMSATGTGASSGTLAMSVTHSATSTGTGASAGSLNVVREIPITSTGTGTSAGSLDAQIVLAPVEYSLASTGNSQSSGGSLAVTAVLAASSTGTGTSDGSLAVTALMPITSSGSTASTGSIEAVRAIPMAATGDGATTGSLEAQIQVGAQEYSLAATGNSQSSGGSLAVTALLPIAATGNTTSEGSAIVVLVVSLGATGTGVTAGSLEVLRESPISATGTGATSGSIDATITNGPQEYSLASTGNMQSGGSLAVGGINQLSTIGESTSSGSLAVGLTMAASATGATSSDGTLAVQTSMPLAATGDGASSGTLAMSLVAGVISYALASTGHSQSGGSLAVDGANTLSASGTTSPGGEIAITAILAMRSIGVSVSTGTLLLWIGLMPQGGADILDTSQGLTVSLLERKRDARWFDGTRPVTGDLKVRRARRV